MEVTLLGIVGNTLYISPMYGGDHEHTAQIDKITKNDLIERGVKEYDNTDHIECQLHGWTVEEYRERLKQHYIDNKNS